MPGDDTGEPSPCPECGSRDADDQETNDYILEDGTQRRITYCTACEDEKDDGTLRFEVITEKYIRTEIDAEMQTQGS